MHSEIFWRSRKFNFNPTQKYFLKVKVRKKTKLSTLKKNQKVFLRKVPKHPCFETMGDILKRGTAKAFMDSLPRIWKRTKSFKESARSPLSSLMINVFCFSSLARKTMLRAKGELNNFLPHKWKFYFGPSYGSLFIFSPSRRRREKNFHLWVIFGGKSAS